MKIFNENGDFLGDFTEATGTIAEKTKDTISSCFETGMLLGIIGLFISPFWGILAIIGILLFKLISVVLKFIFDCVWWIIRVPFCLLFWRELPNF